MVRKSIQHIIAVALLLVGLSASSLAWAQDAGPVIAPSSIWYDLWTIVQPVIVLLVTTVGPVLVTWIAARIISLLKITDEKQRIDIEANLRTAVHQSSLNAVKYAVTRAGLPVMGGVISPNLIIDAVTYVTEKNPDALKKLGVDDKALEEIIRSKIPEVVRAGR
ncbi:MULTISPECIES: hypothetical protein [unclassified Rhizobium]|uniref:hypothetical protein n=1 Tax=unclassified Rhizobium TaxID=2613769 RepID=UPI00288B563D|nr:MULTISPECIES: hypothetical protein [unclassified Rhizobium]